jgi:hypothetical protein
MQARQLTLFKNSSATINSRMNFIALMREFGERWRQLPLTYQLEILAITSTMFISGSNASTVEGNLKYNQYNFTNQNNTSHFVMLLALSQDDKRSNLFQKIMNNCNSSVFSETAIVLTNYTLAQSECWYGNGESMAGYQINLFKYVNGTVDDFFEKCLAAILDDQCWEYGELAADGIVILVAAVCYCACMCRRDYRQNERVMNNSRNTVAVRTTAVAIVSADDDVKAGLEDHIRRLEGDDDEAVIPYRALR